MEKPEDVLFEHLDKFVREACIVGDWDQSAEAETLARVVCDVFLRIPIDNPTRLAEKLLRINEFAVAHFQEHPDPHHQIPGLEDPSGKTEYRGVSEIADTATQLMKRI